VRRSSCSGGGIGERKDGDVRSLRHDAVRSRTLGGPQPYVTIGRRHYACTASLLHQKIMQCATSWNATPRPATNLVVRIVPKRHFSHIPSGALDRPPHVLEYTRTVHTVVVHGRRHVQKVDFVQIRYANRPCFHDQEYLRTSAMLLSLLFTRSIYAAPRLMNGNARRRWEYQSIGPKQRGIS
jgi:hypothetical protein